MAVRLGIGRTEPLAAPLTPPDGKSHSRPDINNFMPVILQLEDEEEWLGKDSDKDTVMGLLKPYPFETMRAYRVSSDIGNVRNNNPELIQEVSS